jgi:hypothetical protein
MSKLAIAAILVARRHRPLARSALSSRAVSFCVSGTRAICPGHCRYGHRPDCQESHPPSPSMCSLNRMPDPVLARKCWLLVREVFYQNRTSDYALRCQLVTTPASQCALWQAPARRLTCSAGRGA